MKSKQDGSRCECENSRHFDTTDHHRYLNAAATAIMQTPYGAFNVCAACVDTCQPETPLDRNLREIDDAYVAFKKAVHEARTNGATAAEVKRYALALETLFHELRDVEPYAANT